VSSNYNQHSSTNPWHGSGQGTGDAAARWIVQANIMIKAYQSRTDIFPLQSPNKHHQLPLSIDAFMDDTWLPAPNLQNLPLPELATQAQTNLQLWHDILQSSGGQLNPKKGVWMLFHWIHKPSGETKISIPPNPPTITTTIAGAEPYAIRQLNPNEAHRYLGIQLTTDGNTKQELKLFQDRTTHYTQFMHQCLLTAREA